VLVGGAAGANSPESRARIPGGREWCGLALDPEANSAARGPSRLDGPGSRIEAWVFPVDEESLLVEHAASAIEK